MSDEEIREKLCYVILTERHPDTLSLAVSTMIREGWQLHGELKLQTMADGTSPALASLVYIQAMRRDLPKTRTPRASIVRKDPRKDPRFLRG